MGNEKTSWNRSGHHFSSNTCREIRPPNDDSIPKDVSLPLVPYQKVFHDWLVVNRAGANAMDSERRFLWVIFTTCSLARAFPCSWSASDADRDRGKSLLHGSFFIFLLSSIRAMLNRTISMPTLLSSYLLGKRYPHWIVAGKGISLDLIVLVFAKVNSTSERKQ